MASPEVLDFSQLLSAVPGENPAGEDVRLDFSPASPYRELRTARDKAREAERYLLYKGGEDDHGQAVSLPDWRPVLQLAPKILIEQSKDLEVAAILTEGLVRRHGFAGLRDGFRLMRELVEQYWDVLYPMPDEDGLKTRVIPLVRLNGEEGEGLLVEPILRVPITEGSAAGSYSALDYRQAADLDAVQDPERRARRLAMPGVVTLVAFQKSVAQTSAAFFANLREDLEQCLEEYRRLGALLEEYCGMDESGYPIAPPTSNLRGALESVRDDVRRIGGETAAGSALEAAGSADSVSGTGGGGVTAGPIGTREDAFRTLLRVAEFFKRTEPHSPISYALEQAVRWGRMGLPELLHELIPEEAVRTQLFKLVGIAQHKGPEGSG